MTRPIIHAVIWSDTALGLPLSFTCDTPEAAIAKAQEITTTEGYGRGFVAQLRAITLDQNDTIHTLWETGQ